MERRERLTPIQALVLRQQQAEQFATQVKPEAQTATEKLQEIQRKLIDSRKRGSTVTTK